MSLPIDRTTKSALDTNLVNGNTSDAPVIKNSNDVVYNTIDELYNYTSGLVAGGALQPYPFGLNRQALINGNFDIWQRGTSVSYSNNISTGNAAGYGSDRWWSQSYGGGTATGTSTVIQSQQSHTIGQSVLPNNPKFFIRVNQSVLSTQSGTGSVLRTIQRIESVYSFAGRTVTLSFWAKADTSRTISVALTQSFGTGGSPSPVVDIVGTTTTFNLTTAWQQFSTTFTLPSISGKVLGSNNDDVLMLQFIMYKLDNTTVSLPSGVVGTYAAGLFDFSQIQLNDGNAALPFQPKSYNQENLDCLRYRWQSWADSVVSPFVGSYSGYALTTSALVVNAKFPVPMRVSPTLGIQNNNVVNQVRNTSTGVIVAAIFSSASGPSNKGFPFLSFTGTPFTVGQYYDFDIVADAEL